MARFLASKCLIVPMKTILKKLKESSDGHIFNLLQIFFCSVLYRIRTLTIAMFLMEKL